MLCEICHENEARVTYTEIINGVKKEQHLCENCAAKQPPFSLMARGVPEMQFGNILSGLLQTFASGLGATQERESICGRCGMTASEFVKTGRLGCPDCYNAFAPILDKNLRTVQGAIENKSKRPMNAVYFEPASVNTDMTGNTKDGIGAIPVMDVPAESGTVLGTAGTMDEILGNTSKKKGKVSPARKKKNGKLSGTSGSATKTADQDVNNNDEIASLRKRMDDAVRDEDYEEAARLRDVIRSYDSRNS